MLFLKGRMIKINGEIQLKTFVWTENRPFIIQQSFYWLENLDELLWRIQFLQTALHEQINKRSCTSIHNWHFESSNLDNQVINSQSGNGTHHMFNRAHLGIFLHQVRTHKVFLD